MLSTASSTSSTPRQGPVRTELPTPPDAAAAAGGGGVRSQSDAGAVVIHLATGQAQAGSPMAPSFLDTHAPTQGDALEPGPSLLNRSRQCCCRANKIATPSIIVGSVTLAAMTALSGCVIGKGDWTCGTPTGEVG